MDAESSILTIKNIHGRINAQLFDRIFETYSLTVQSLYYKYNHNTIEVFRYLSRDNKIKLWSWIKSLGITNIILLREAYCIISVIYNKLKSEVEKPSNIKSLLEKHKCENMICFIVDLTDSEIKELIEWCKTWLIDLELAKAKTSSIYYYEEREDDTIYEDLKINNLPTPKGLNPKIAPFVGQNNIIASGRGSGEVMRVSTTPRHISLRFPLNTNPLARAHEGFARNNLNEIRR